MMEMGSAGKSLLRATVVAVTTALLSACVAHASDLTYTFTGEASGTIFNVTQNTTTLFTDQSFTIQFLEDPTNLTTNGPNPPDNLFTHYGLDGGSTISGSFSEGSYSNTITGAILEVNGNPWDGVVGHNFEDVFLFNNDLSGDLGIFSDPAFLNYALAGPVSASGTDTGASFGASGGDGFSTTNGDIVSIDSVESLNFTVTGPTSTSVTPEPSTLLLLTTGVAGLGGLLRRRFCA